MHSRQQQRSADAMGGSKALERPAAERHTTEEDLPVSSALEKGLDAIDLQSNGASPPAPKAPASSPAPSSPVGVSASAIAATGQTKESCEAPVEGETEDTTPAKANSSPAETPPHPGSVLRVLVGGVQHSTTLGTLAAAGADSALSQLRPCPAGAPLPFIDRDGALFAHVLSFLRAGTLPQSAATRRALCAEASALRIPTLTDALEAAEKDAMRVGVLVCERVTVLAPTGAAVDGHFSIGGKVERAARWFPGSFDPERLVAGFQIRVGEAAKAFAEREGLVLKDTVASAAIGREEKSGRAMHVHTLTLTFRSPIAGVV